MNMNASGVIVCSNIFITLNTAAEHSMTCMRIGGINNYGHCGAMNYTHNSHSIKAYVVYLFSKSEFTLNEVSIIIII